jgi:acarbose 7IV-phosphotransferase
MTKILVSGLINIETTLLVDGFPLPYTPVRYPFHGVNSTVSGVGYNVAAALSSLGSQVNLLSLIGQDIAGDLVRQTLQETGISTDGLVASLEKTPQSVILYDRSGKRQINTDLKDIQERAYPSETFTQALQACSVAVLCNIKFSRSFLEPARQSGKLIATDVHAISNLEDDYNRDFMEAAHILFMSHESLPCSPAEWSRAVMERFGPEIVVIGLGEQGALLNIRGQDDPKYFPAVFTRPVVSTIGAGDALFSAFIHFFQRYGDARTALEKAVVFASYKIGEAGASEGFLSEDGLIQLYSEIHEWHE